MENEPATAMSPIEKNSVSTKGEFVPVKLFNKRNKKSTVQESGYVLTDDPPVEFVKIAVDLPVGYRVSGENEDDPREARRRIKEEILDMIKTNNIKNIDRVISTLTDNIRLETEGQISPKDLTKYARRIFTVGYRIYPDRTTNNIEFAGSVFRRESKEEKVRKMKESGCDDEKKLKKVKDDVYVKSAHLKTTRGRLEVRPNVATFPIDNEYRRLFTEKPKFSSREERIAWRETREHDEWKELRQRFDEDIKNFLLKEIYRQGVRNKNRLRRSEIVRNRACGIVPNSSEAELGRELRKMMVTSRTVNGMENLRQMLENATRVERGRRH